jgi:hypothetical protein
MPLTVTMMTAPSMAFTVGSVRKISHFPEMEVAPEIG